ncbi:hypothetical protein CEUSTIGMA_g10828.t1 [Chlamydomonas eustigma]|uniref:Protein PTHB1 n=1 Tax=Chlamydomonas eustigma TaxID=1157962 RepID=A0A250XK42_9CHLO|nr:hypothetical protein CEUSTIGMA_g10828.t1 [Chlamydomonas eustigma]|eukprot:GAX83403.1 hypothetical protein CEUSTIGMA_g10828.t1 [Chlamydomonas eustigma]
MSLFKAREWWHASVGQGEEFDVGSMCIQISDTSSIPTIVTGSFKGVLRIYRVTSRDYKVDDLLLEQELDAPILQVESGRFSSTGGIQLAVLHPRKLVVYNAMSVESNYMQLNKLFEHGLEHTAANLTYGPFGGASGLDYICVQSFDGLLSIFECESFTFARFLPNFLIPGPLAYCEQSDSFVTCSSSFELESYKYKGLAAASGEKPTDVGSASMGYHTSKRVQADWRLVLGEVALDIRPGKISQGLQAYQADIVVLCEHNVFVVSSIGQITFQKRLEYHPACFCTYPVPGAKTAGGPENLLVATHTRNLLVYRGTTLAWSAHTDTQPVAVAVADLGPSLRGVIITLDDSGALVVSYLGTDPMLTPMGLMEGKDLDYEAMAREHRSLAAVIREHSGGARVEPASQLLLKTQIPSRFDYDDGADGRLSSSDGIKPHRKLTVKLYLVYHGPSSEIDAVQLHVKAPEPVLCENPLVVLPYISNDPLEPSLALISFLPGNGGLPASSTAVISVSYTTTSGETRAQSIEIELPLCLFCSVTVPVKSATFKITVCTNRTPPQLTALYEDLLSQVGVGTSQALSSGSAGANVLSFLYYSGHNCTILVSKQGGKYRLQSDRLEAIWLTLHELQKRLHAYYVAADDGALPSDGEGPLRITFEDALPMDDFFEVVDHHFEIRLRAGDLRKKLEDRAIQFRNIEKRLLMKFKDKNPSPLNQLDFLMDETYDSIMETGSVLDVAMEQLADAANKLACTVQLILILIRYRFQCTAEEFSVLKSYLSPEVVDGPEIGWEECVEAGMMHLLRSSLAKSSKETSVSIPMPTPAKDTSKLRKHIGLVLERLAKGMRMTLDPDDLSEASNAAATLSRTRSTKQAMY